MISVNLSPEQSKFLMKLASRAKELDVLEGGHRRALFQAGRFSKWYPNRVELVLQILQELREHISEHDVVQEIDEIISMISEINVEKAELEYLLESGNASPAERFRLAEMYVHDERRDVANEMLSALREEGYESDDLTYYVELLRNE